jgi:hypothetical protein
LVCKNRNPSPIKKIINKKVIIIAKLAYLPVLKCYSPILFNTSIRGIVFLKGHLKFQNMRHRDHFHLREREHHPQVGIGLFFIVLGLALLVATNDLLNLGNVGAYFTWQTIMIFIGVLLLLNLRFTGGLLLIAGGTWFLMDDIFVVVPRIIEITYWPAVIIMIGLTLIFSSLLKRKNNSN